MYDYDSPTKRPDSDMSEYIPMTRDGKRAVSLSVDKNELIVDASPLSQVETDPGANFGAGLWSWSSDGEALSHGLVGILAQTANVALDLAALSDTATLKSDPTVTVPTAPIGPCTQHCPLYSRPGHKE